MQTVIWRVTPGPAPFSRFRDWNQFALSVFLCAKMPDMHDFPLGAESERGHRRRLGELAGAAGELCQSWRRYGTGSMPPGSWTTRAAASLAVARASSQLNPLA